MAKLLYFIVLLLSSFCISAQVIAYEQKAVDYFFKNVFPKEYEKVKVIEFNGLTADELSNFQHFEACFKGEHRLQILLREQSFEKRFSEKSVSLAGVDGLRVKRLKWRSSKRLKLEVLLDNEINGRHFVFIVVTKMYHQSNAYMFEIDAEGEVRKSCKTGLIY